MEKAGLPPAYPRFLSEIEIQLEEFSSISNG